MTTGRRIVHLDTHNLYVSVEQLKNSSLRGQPLVIAGQGERGIVTACSSEAARFGVRPGMPTKSVRMFCRQAVIMKGDTDEYSKYSDLVTEVLDEKAPLLEKMNIQEHYI